MEEAVEIVGLVREPPAHEVVGADAVRGVRAHKEPLELLATLLGELHVGVAGSNHADEVIHACLTLATALARSAENGHQVSGAIGAPQEEEQVQRLPEADVHRPVGVPFR